MCQSYNQHLWGPKNKKVRLDALARFKPRTFIQKLNHEISHKVHHKSKSHRKFITNHKSIHHKRPRLEKGADGRARRGGRAPWGGGPPPPPPACGVRSWMPGARGGHAEVGEGGAHEEEEHHQWEGVPRPLYIVRRRSPLSQWGGHRYCREKAVLSFRRPDLEARSSWWLPEVGEGGRCEDEATANGRGATAVPLCVCVRERGGMWRSGGEGGRRAASPHCHYVWERGGQRMRR